MEENILINGKTKKVNKSNIDWMITIVPLALIVGLSILFFVRPEQSNNIISQVRFLLGDTLGSYYLIIGLGVWKYRFR